MQRIRFLKNAFLLFRVQNQNSIARIIDSTHFKRVRVRKKKLNYCLVCDHEIIKKKMHQDRLNFVHGLDRKLEFQYEGLDEFRLRKACLSTLPC